MTTTHPKELKTILNDLEKVTDFYQNRLSEFESRENSLPAAETAVQVQADESVVAESNGVPQVEVASGDILHDIECDHDLTPSEIEEIRHGGNVTIRDFFRSLLMANEPSQRIQS